MRFVTSTSKFSAPLVVVTLLLPIIHNCFVTPFGFVPTISPLPKTHEKVRASSKTATAFFVSTRSTATTATTKLYMSVPNPIDTLTSGLASIVCLPYGVTVSESALSLQRLSTDDDDDASKATPPRLLMLYDIENSKPCRTIRERITELDLVVERIIPAAENSRVFQDPTYEFALPKAVVGTTTTGTIPRLVVLQDGTGTDEKILVGVDDIMSFLNTECAVKESSSFSRDDNDEDFKEKTLAILKEIGGYVATFLRFGRGMKVCSAAAVGSNPPRPNKPLILYSYEGNQFCRLVREVLTELDIVYELRSAGKNSPRRAELAGITGGSTQCPFLIDPNTNIQMAESADIIRYLYKTYALWTPPNEILEAASSVITPLLKPLYEILVPLQAGSNRDDQSQYEAELAQATSQIENEVASHPVVVYTYSLSPFCTEATGLLDNLDITYKEISLGKEWIPGLISDPMKRAALGKMTGQTSLPHVFIGGKSIGGLFSGTPGLIPSLKQGTLLSLVEEAKAVPSDRAATDATTLDEIVSGGSLD